MAAIAPGLIAPPSNGTLINGVAHFVTTSKPTVRVDGSALVVGDRWYKTDDGTEWWWNGTYWLSTQIFNVQGQVINAASTNNYINSTGQAIVFSDRNSIFVERAQVTWEYTGYTINDYWTLQVNIDRGGASGATVSLLMNNYVTTSGAGVYELAVNTAITFTADYPIGVRAWTLRTGNPGNLFTGQGYRYRLIAP